MDEKVRADKWMWAVRLFKTRALAAEACEKGKISIGDQPIKAARPLKEGDILLLHRGAWKQTIKVMRLTTKRMGAALVKDYAEDTSSPEELEKLKLYLAARADWNPKGGSGRPTKKDRREMDDFLDF